MARMQLWPGQLVEMERTVVSAALAAQGATAVLAVRVQKLVLIRPAATAVQADWAATAATQVPARPGRIR